MTNQITPFELRLANDLDIEWQRFGNKWLVPWHQINVEGRIVDVEDFRGGRIQTGGVLFEGQTQQTYWEAISRYLSLKAHEVMQLWDEGTRSYAVAQRRSSLDRTAGLLTSFVGRVIQRAVDIDRRLRGCGYPERVAPYSADREHVRAKTEVTRIAEAYRTLLAGQPTPLEAAGGNRDTSMPNATLGDFQAQAKHEADRTLNRIDQDLRTIEARRAADRCLLSGGTVKKYSRAVVAGLEEYLGYLAIDIETFASSGVARAEMIEVAKACLVALQDQVKANRTITKLERRLNLPAAREHLEQQLRAFEAHSEAHLARSRLGLPPTSRNLGVTVEYDVFISHASEDKDSVARPLAEALRKNSLKVWFDEFSLEWGASLRREIDKGLANSRYSVVVLSHHFFRKGWPQAELDGLLTREFDGGGRVLPIWHNVTKDDVVKFSPILASKLARDTSLKTVQELVEELTGLCRQANDGDDDERSPL